MVRTALFNWAYARHTGGTFVFRIEDTDAARDSESSYQSLLDCLRWLGMEWDEGPEVGGPHGPYRQSQRSDLYRAVIAELAEAGYTYPCYCTAEELAAHRESARLAGKPSGYAGTCRHLSDEQRAAHEAAGRPAVTRFAMPEGDSTWEDLVRGTVTFPAGQVPDFVLVRANGDPLYTLVNPVDDADMQITHVLRGEDLLSSTPRQLALHAALVAIGRSASGVPRFGHLPYVMGEGNKKLSKRDPEASFSFYLREGYLPEAMINYLSLLGWSFGNDVEFFSPRELVENFDIARVNPNPARFDLKKCTAINGDWIRHLAAADLVGRVVPFLSAAGFVDPEPDSTDREVLTRAMPLVSERMETLAQAVGMLGFLFADRPGRPAFAIDADDASKLLDEAGREVVSAAATALASLPDWSLDAIEAALRAELIERRGLKPRLAFGPVRVAVTGRRVSPPLFESLELLGREVALGRLERAAARSVSA